MTEITMNGKPIVLDICCRMGGATVGYQRAGFYVIGVDIEPQSGYPGDSFVKADGIEILRSLIVDPTLLSGARPALIHQSWPCQEGNAATIGTNASRGWGGQHEQFIPRARELSDRIGIPYVIEQPASSRKGLIRRDLTLCMDTFKGTLPPPWVQKHRSFELNGFTVPQPKHVPHKGYVRGWRHGVLREGRLAPYVAGYGKGGGKATAGELRHAMGIDWMTDRFDLCEAIPPAYAQYIGSHFLCSS
jgi:hypothetical protein